MPQAASDRHQCVTAQPGYFLLVWPKDLTREQALTQIIPEPIVAWSVCCTYYGEPRHYSPEPITLFGGLDSDSSNWVVYAIQAPDGRVFDPQGGTDVSPGWFTDLKAWLHGPEVNQLHADMRAYNTCK